ncbi:MAG: YfhO family protein [Anaerolineae bacterium]
MFLLLIAGPCGLAALILRRQQTQGRVRRDWQRDVLAIGLLALLTAAFFWRLLFTVGVWMPAGGGDLAGFLYPTYHFTAESLKKGQIPLWNPYLYAGAPHVADIQSGVFYPINLLAFLLTGEVTYRLMELLSVLHFFVAGTAMYLFLRLLRPPPADQSSSLEVGRSSLVVERLARPACLAGAVALMFSDFFVTHFGNLNLIAVSAWLPMVFLGTYRALNQRSVGWALLGGLFLAVAALAGHAQPLQFIVLLVGLYTLCHLITERRQGWRWALQTVGLAGLVGVVGLGLAALSLLPALEMVGYTRRASLTYAEASQYSLPPQALIGLLVPDFFGRGVAGFWAPWPRVEVGYLGVLPLLLAAVGVTLRRRERLVPFLASLAFLSLLLASGANTPLHRWVYGFLPGFQNLRVPARFIYLMDFALAALAALGMDALLRSRADSRRVARATPWAGSLPVVAVIASGYLFLKHYQPAPEQTAAALRGLVVFGALLVASVTLIVARVRHWLNARLFSGLCVAVVALDLIGLGAGVDVGRQDPTANFHRPQVVEFLRSDPSLYRIEVRPEVWGWWSPDAALIHGFQDAGGIYNPLRLSDYLLYWESLTDRETRLYDFVNAKYLIAPPNFGLPWDKFAPVLDDGDLTVYLNREALPRVQMIYDVLVVGDQTTAFHTVHADGFDPTQTVVLETIQPSNHPTNQPTSQPAIQPSSHLAFAGYDLNTVAIDVTTDTPGYLVMSDVWYPGWRAQIDGAAAPVLRANYAFRAVPVPAGSHRVTLSFAPLTWGIGVAISVTVLLVTALTAIWRWRRDEAGRRRGEASRIDDPSANKPAFRLASPLPTLVLRHTR